MKEKTQKTVLEQLNNLKVKEKVSFPILNMGYVKVACTTYGKRIWGKTFKTDTVTDRSKIIVTRIK